MVKRSSRSAPRGARRAPARAKRVYAKPAGRRTVRTAASKPRRAAAPRELRIVVVTDNSGGTSGRPFDGGMSKPAPAATPPRKAQF